MPKSEDAARKQFVQDIVAALRQAEEEAARPKSTSELASDCYQRLQFDFPVVTPEGLRALADAYASGRAGYPLTPKLLETVREGAGAVAASSTAPAAAPPTEAAASSSAAVPGSATEQLLPQYQQLYGSVLAWALEAALMQGSTEAAAVALGQLGQEEDKEGASVATPAAVADEGGGASSHAEGASPEPVPAHHISSAQQDLDGELYEPMDAKHTSGTPGRAGRATLEPATGATATVPPQQQLGERGSCIAQPSGAATALRHLTHRHLAGSYHRLADPGLWQQRRLGARLAACLAAARRHPGFAAGAELQEAAAALVALACDRMAAAPAELEDSFPALLQALAVEPGAAPVPAPAVPPATAAAAQLLATSLALVAGASLAGRLSTLSARRRLWQEVHDGLLPAAAAMLEARQVALARRARQRQQAQAQQEQQAAGAALTLSVDREEWEGIAAACRLVYFYVLEAPPAVAAAAEGARLQEALLRGGLFRALVLLFCQLGGMVEAEALRCVLLLSCAANPGLLQWACAVPGFGPSLSQPALAPGGVAVLHGALWAVVRQAGDDQLVALLEAEAGSAAGVPALHQVLTLMADLHTAARGRRLWTPAVDTALRQLMPLLRDRYSKPADDSTAGEPTATTTGSEAVAGERNEAAEAAAAEAVEAEERRKVERCATEQAEVLALRQAQQLQPACLRLLKTLLQKQGASGKSD